MRNLIKGYMEKCLKEILGDEYSLLKDFFDVIRHDAADYIIFISRRCFVLYQMISYIENWKRDNVISDRGIWTYRNSIKQAYRIVLADDILIWGSAMQNAYQLLDSVLDSKRKYEVKKVIYCGYAENDKNNIADIHFFSKRSMRECRVLTNKLARSIMESGIPYTTFLYPFYGRDCERENMDRNDALTFKKVKATEGKWDSYYDFKLDTKLQNMVECLCDGACVRYYHQSMDGFLCVIPFAFISDVKDQKMDFFYGNISECCHKSGWKELAEEIEKTALEESKEKWVYLSMLLSCILSRVIGVVEHLDVNFGEECDREITWKSLEGVFSRRIIECVEKLNEEGCAIFAEEISCRQEIWNSCLDRLSNKDGKGDHNACLDELLTQFGEMRLEYENSHKSEDKRIDCHALYEQYSGRYPRQTILAAQIECYDVGIVTYGFEYEDTDGIVAKCGIGERSSVLFALKFSNLIHKYFIVNSETENKSGVLNDIQRKNNLDRILESEEMTTDEKKVFWTGIRNNVENIYDYYLNN